MYYVYRTLEFDADVDSLGHRSRIDALQESIHEHTMLTGFERFPPPFIKKRIENLRLVAELVDEGESTAVCFVRFVPRGDRAYSRFAEYDDVEGFRTTYSLDRAAIRADLRRRCAGVEPESGVKLSQSEAKYLTANVVLPDHEHTIVETRAWLDAMGRAETRQVLSTLYQLAERAATGGVTRIETHERLPVALLNRQYPDYAITVLDAVSVPGGPMDMNALKLHSTQSSQFDRANSREEVLRLGRRAYPAFILADYEIWSRVQASRDANLALSPEENELLRNASAAASGDSRFPLFVNGRPGSGKSTVLQYLYANYLYSYLKLKPLDLPPPIYLTYGEGLLNRARDVVGEILTSNAAIQSEGAISKEEFQLAIRQSMQPFRQFMKARLPERDRERFADADYLNFPRFKNNWVVSFRGVPDVAHLGPELCWHVIRTYIKGMRQEGGEDYDVGSYHEHPKKRRSVSPETFGRVYDRVYSKWYRELKLWDDQDLVRAVLDCDSDLSSEERVTYPGVFCDEAQDFTRQELEFIRSICRYAYRDMPSRELRNVPMAFAGDPFQTLNPTGFDWKAVQADFHESLAAQSGAHRVTFQYAELHSNYRSAEPIVQFCNAIQWSRINVFGLQGVAPQKAYFESSEAAATPEWYLDTNPLVRTEIEVQDDAVILVPCAEGGEEEYVRKDPLLNSIRESREEEARKKDAPAAKLLVMSAMAAKGLEFVRVVLYKFGDEAVRDPAISSLFASVAPHADLLLKERTLGAEYFLNRLYVASSRAREVLLIVDTERGITAWKQIVAPIGPPPPGWTTRDVSQMIAGREDGWKRRRDPPEELASNFFRKGQSDRDSDSMEVAARLYDKLNRAKDAARSRALGAEFANNFLEAAFHYQGVGLWGDCVRCLWQAQAFEKIAAITVPLDGLCLIQHRASQFVALAAPSPSDLLNLLDEWMNDIDLRTSIAGDFGWTKVAAIAVSRLASAKQGTSDVYLKALAPIKRAAARGLTIPATIELAQLSARAGDHAYTATTWSQLENRLDVPSEVADSLAQALPFPENLPHLARLEKWEIIHAQGSAENRKLLSPDQQIALVRAALRIGTKLETAAMLAESTSTDTLERVLRLTEFRSDLLGRRWILQRLASLLARQRRYEQLARVLRDFPRADDLLNFAFQVTVRSVLDADTFADAPRASRAPFSKFISDSVDDLIHAGVSLEGGAIVERNGHFIDALTYYEEVAKRTKSAHDKRAALIRWACVKRRQLSQASNPIGQRSLERRLQSLGVTASYIDGLPEFPPARDFSTVAQVQWPVPEGPTRSKQEPGGEANGAAPEPILEPAPDHEGHTKVAAGLDGGAAIAIAASRKHLRQEKSTPPEARPKRRAAVRHNAPRPRVSKPPLAIAPQPRAPTSVEPPPVAIAGSSEVKPYRSPESIPVMELSSTDMQHVLEISALITVDGQELRVLWNRERQFVRFEDRDANSLKLKLANGPLAGDVEVAGFESDRGQSWDVPCWGVRVERLTCEGMDRLVVSASGRSVVLLNLGSAIGV